MLNVLRSFRERRGLSESELADELEVSRQTIVSLEKGKYDPSLPLAKQIARLFRVAVEDVFPADTEEAVLTRATFLMTDIEGSTSLVTSLGERYVELLRRHRELLIDVFTSRGGRVVDDTGDAAFAVFASPPEAIAAAMAAQASVAATRWPGEASLRIRIGIHSGEAFAVGNRFVGLAVHETARVCAEASGGQILVSEAAAGDGGTALRDSGSRELQGLGPRRLYVVQCEG